MSLLKAAERGNNHGPMLGQEQTPLWMLDKNAAKAAQSTKDSNSLKLIDRERIIIGDQPRRSFPVEEQAELSESIKELQGRKEGIEATGLLAPLLVVAQDDKYRLVAGERRYRATEPTHDWIGVAGLPCIILPPGSDILLLQLLENLQRADLPVLEEAEGIQSLVETHKITVRAAAQLLSKDKGYIDNRIRLAKAGDDVKSMVASLHNDRNVMSHGLLIQGVEDKDLRRKLITKVKSGASYQHIRQLVEEEEPKPKKANTAAPSSPPITTTATDTATRSLVIDTDTITPPELISVPSAPQSAFGAPVSESQPIPASQGVGMATDTTPKRIEAVAEEPSPATRPRFELPAREALTSNEWFAIARIAMDNGVAQELNEPFSEIGRDLRCADLLRTQDRVNAAIEFDRKLKAV